MFEDFSVKNRMPVLSHAKVIDQTAFLRGIAKRAFCNTVKHIENHMLARNRLSLTSVSSPQFPNS